MQSTWAAGAGSTPVPMKKMGIWWTASGLPLNHAPNALSFRSHFLSWPQGNKMRLYQMPYEIEEPLPFCACTGLGTLSHTHTKLFISRDF